ncbi:MAG: hypothetical protein Q9M94_01915 [Candidatus Gracilibacteria bacterium]|nr:hypothetical protein [Candidatus Gracilibacteria bacterium]MDQ7023748.1 hypothetical protein [Candidatus Gracilibacteria bacterium]
MLEIINYAVIVAAAFLIIYVAITKKDKNLVTVIGILGTFIGIILGLIAFDTTNIEQSIGTLLNGLKTAFLTSIFGLIANLVLSFLEKKEVSDEIKNDSDFLIEIRDELKILNSKKKTEVSQNREEEVINELKKINISNNNLENSFKTFAKEMSENNSKALIEAMEKVMNNFNSKINDQLGESFKDLSNSTKNLLIWQEEYKKNINISNDIINKSAISLENSNKAFKQIVENSKEFDVIAQNLSGELKALNKSIEILQAGGNEFKEVSYSIKDMSNTLIRSVEGLSKSFMGKAEMILSENEKQVIGLRNAFSKLSTNLEQTHTDILLNLREQIEKDSQFTSNQFLKIQKRLEQQVSDLDTQLGEELEKSLHSLGQQLTGLSQKFVSDYGSLAEKLEKLVK